MSNKLLLDDKPLLIIPSLAKKIGLNESIILQQMHYWLKKSNHTYEGHKWIYNTYDDWVEQFSWWSKATIRRIITKLENEGFLVTGNFNKIKIDKTKWYRINYEVLEGMSSPCAQNEQSRCSKRVVEEINLSTPIPEITTEITSDIEEVEEHVYEYEYYNIFKFYEENGFGTLSSYMIQKIQTWEESLSSELVIEAMKIAVESSTRNWKYVETILRDWTNKGYKNIKQVHAAQLEYREKKAKHHTPKIFKTRTEPIPYWMNQQDKDKDLPISPEMDKEEFEKEKKKLFDRIRNYKEQKE